MSPEEARKIVIEADTEKLNLVISEINAVLKKHDYSLQTSGAINFIGSGMYSVVSALNIVSGFRPVVRR